MEVLGTYDPIPKTPLDSDGTGRKYKDIQLDIARAKYWLGVGAQPSDPAWRLLSMVGLVEPKFRPGQINSVASTGADGSENKTGIADIETLAELGADADAEARMEKLGKEMNENSEKAEAAAV